MFRSTTIIRELVLNLAIALYIILYRFQNARSNDKKKIYFICMFFVA